MKRFLLLIFVFPIYLVAEQNPTNDVAKTIIYLLDYVEKSDAVFIRNGSTHNGKAAAAHLKSKYKHFKKETKIPEDFIRLCTTNSTVSDKPYLVRLNDGKEIPCSEWLEKVLKDYRQMNLLPAILTLFIEPSSTSVAGGKATLDVGLLKLTTGAFLGEYKVKVVPYVFQNENGKLSIMAPEDSLAKLTNQLAVDFVGQATSSDGISKRIDGKITPSNRREGTVSLWFMAGKRKMIFNTAYHFVEK